MLTRRQLLRLGLFGGAGVLTGASVSCSPRGFGSQTGSAAQPVPSVGPGTASPHIGAFQRPLPLPSVLSPARTDDTTDYYEITMKEAQMEILPGKGTTIWGYNGSYPGPTIRARSARRVVVRQSNGLREGVSVHLHGGHVPGDMDGHPNDLIQPGAFKEYVYPNSQQAATLWYHDHAMDMTAEHVFRGLAGFYLIEDEVEESLPLPRGEYDVPLVIQDRLFNSDGSLHYALTLHPMGGMGGMGPGGMGGMGPGGMGGMGGMMGMMADDRIFLGDTILVSGAVQPYFQVASRKYRFRILNGSNAREYDLALSSRQPFVQIATDNGLMEAPIARQSLYLSSAERVEVVVDFSGYEVGDQVVLENRLETGPLAAVMRFDVVRKEADDSSVPARLRPFEQLQARDAARTRSFTLSQGGEDRWLINGRAYDTGRLELTARQGDVEVWEFFNRSMMAHPVHIHQTSWQILGRGRGPVPAWEHGWKDTFRVQPMETVRVIGRYSPYAGDYVFHCHVLEHEDRGMMAQFRVT